MYDVERIRNGEADCSSILDTTQAPRPAEYMVDGKPLCRFCFDALLTVAEVIA